jgi:ATP-dependent Clp protease ATP-binding subunit ClpB
MGREMAPDDKKRRAIGELQNRFRPEFLNRIDEIIVFDSLGREELRGIVTIQLDRLAAVLMGQNITLEATDGAKDLIAAMGYDPSYGARPLKRVIQREVQNSLAEAILKGELGPGSSVRMDSDGDTLVFVPN